MTARISVVIPVYNCAPYIANAIDSALSQRGCSVEVLVVDDGSNDGTREVVTRYGSPVHYVRQEHAGVAAARNRGLQLATGDYVAFLDGDDTWYSDKLAIQVDVLNRYPECVATFSNFHIVDQSGAITHENGIENNYAIFKVEERPLPSLFDLKSDTVYIGDLFSRLFLGNFINTCSVCAHREVVKRVGCFDTTLVTQEDYDYWLRLAQTGKIAYIDQPLLTRSRIPGQLTGEDHRLQVALDVATVIRRYAPRAAQSLDRAVINRRLEKTYRVLAINYLTVNSKRKARELLWKGLKLRGLYSKSALLLVWSLLPQPLADAVRRRFSKASR